MKIPFLLALLLSVKLTAFSQESYIVNAGENPALALPIKFRMLNPSFEDGFLTFANDTKTDTEKFNYDLLSNAIVYMNDKMDTSLIANDLNIKYMHIAGQDYNHVLNTGYVKILSFNSTYSLGSLTKLIGLAINKANIGYGTQSATSVTSSISTRSVTTDVKYMKETQYFLLDKQGSVLSCRKSNFLKMFYAQDDLIKTYVKREGIDFKSETDLIELFNYCVSLFPE